MGDNLAKLAYEVSAKDLVWPALPIVMADLDTGEILYISKAACDIFGYSLSEISLKPLELLLPEDIRESHVKWRQAASIPEMRTIGVGRPVRGRRSDGSLFPVHVGLGSMETMGKRIGVAFIVDLTGFVFASSHSATGSQHDIDIQRRQTLPNSQ